MPNKKTGQLPPNCFAEPKEKKNEGTISPFTGISVSFLTSDAMQEEDLSPPSKGGANNSDKSA
ncbi:MAG TPA: hypothetical protein DIW30_05225 [Bacteroidales bacterium]|nr:hypothetical protein [Bacteroidales bacterium]